MRILAVLMIMTVCGQALAIDGKDKFIFKKEAPVDGMWCLIPHNEYNDVFCSSKEVLVHLSKIMKYEEPSCELYALVYVLTSVKSLVVENKNPSLILLYTSSITCVDPNGSKEYFNEDKMFQFYTLSNMAVNKGKNREK